MPEKKNIIKKKTLKQVYRNLARSAENFINRALMVPILWKSRPHLVHFCHSKTIPFLVQAFKTLPFVVSKVAKIGPYRPGMGVYFPGGGVPPWGVNTVVPVCNLSTVGGGGGEYSSTGL